MMADSLVWQAEAAEMAIRSMDLMREAGRLEVLSQVCSDEVAIEILDCIEAGKFDLDTLPAFTSGGGCS